MPSRHAKSRSAVPGIWLMTDERVKEADLLRAVRRLPFGAGVILRHHSWPGRKRRVLLVQIRAAGRGRRLLVLLAGKPGRAARWGADGWHGLARSRGEKSGRSRGLLHSASAHDLAELRAAQRAGADLVFVSPLFATRSHPGVKRLGVYRFAAIARRSRVPVMALGGVSPRHAALIRRLGASGFGAIDGLVSRR
ncbi:thiamine phosphate synthase [Sphingobium sp. CR28]|uniref:thiamine phosphate synthase n=1 Tax=Sphingobium sp. CR28 TaxID=3400272 RepID=UPI003FEEFDD9